MKSCRSAARFAKPQKFLIKNKKERMGKAAGRSGTAKAAGAVCGLFAAVEPSEFNGAVVHAIEDQLEGGFF